MNWFSKFLAATFLSAAMLLPGAVQGQALIGTGDIPPCFLERNPLSPTIYTACKDWKANGENEALAAIGLPTARKKFWDTYPNKPDAPQASQEFADWLFLKDLNYLQSGLIVLSRVDPRDAMAYDSRDFIRAMSLAPFVGNTPILDGGIRDDAADEFYDWVKDVAERLGYPGDPFTQSFALGLMGPSIGKAVEASSAKYKKYVIQRDWEEFEARGVEPDGFDKPAKYFAMMCVRFQGVSWDTAQSEYDGMLKALGEDAIGKAVQQVRSAPKASGGLLRVTAKEPITTTPSGNKVPDPSVPEPEGVIGYVSSPIRAVERLATQGDDRGYLLWLLTQNRPSRSSTIDQATKWQYAETTYNQFRFAFGDQDVLHAAQQVRTATKRMTSGGLMNPTAIGATRSDPYPAFEDIVTRENPSGYVKAVLAVKRNLTTRDKIEAEYNGFVATNGETAVLEAAKKMADDKPNPNYDGDLDRLMRVLNGSLSLEKPVQTLVDDPLYLAWKGFPSGAKVTYVQRGLVRVPPGSNNLVPGKGSIQTTYRMDSIDDKLAHLWRTEVVTYPDGPPHPPTDTEIAYPAKIPQTTNRGPAVTPLESGQETLEVNGRKIVTRWQSSSSPYGNCTIITKTWTSDDVPTGLVRKFENMRCQMSETINETTIESVEGARSGSAGTVGPSQSVSASPSTPVSEAATAHLSKTPGGKGPGQPSSSNLTATSVATSNQAPPNAVVPNPALSNREAQTPPVQAGVPSTPGAPPGSSAQTGVFRERIRADSLRLNKDSFGLTPAQRSTRTHLPTDIAKALDQVRGQLRAAQFAAARGDSGQAEQDLQDAEGALTTIEKSLGQ